MQEQTRTRLLDAAKICISKKGYSGSSIDNITEQAGYTRGAFYSNFASKKDLFIELLRRNEYLDQIVSLNLSMADLNDEDPKSILNLVYLHQHLDQENTILWLEASLYAARDLNFRHRLIALILDKRK
ncbi:MULTISPECIES: TetR/AcrR family transcriptional regulator [unclassified Herbaspirillum]|uniref:TetR/AcrR family transcriptional regulator n=1 Tax=unclassified Herbaspirillum TaxID=2624150 RepID=UPI00161547E8|nr:MULTISPECIES: TetR/AcrR family transcriptional regulator [unclassified Herbaspirillum]MBB5393203.1 AcrR family transcriptional regulator [Herbaspirillum sp. SJZ102]